MPMIALDEKLREQLRDNTEPRDLAYWLSITWTISLWFTGTVLVPGAIVVWVLDKMNLLESLKSQALIGILVYTAGFYLVYIVLQVHQRRKLKVLLSNTTTVDAVQGTGVEQESIGHVE